MVLGTKDLRILKELDGNSRLSDSEVSKKVRLSKQVTNYRIKNLEKKGLIKSYYTIINVGLFGVNSYYVFLQFQNVSESEEKKLMNEIKNKNYVGWLVNGTGRWDAVILIYARSNNDFSKSLSQVLKVCDGKIHEHMFTTLLSAEHLGYTFLDRKNNRSIQSEKTASVKLDETDKKILEFISQNARASIVEISSNIKVPIHNVRYRIKTLIKNKVIESFKPKIDVSKFGYQWYLLLIQFKISDDLQKNNFLKFCKAHKNVYYVTETIGAYNLMLDIQVSSSEEFKKVLSEFKQKHSNIIKLYESLVIFNEYKIDYVTSLSI